MADDLISRQAAIDAVDGVDWYHQNKNGEMVHGANDDEHQAWYKAEDIYKAVESVPSAQRWIPCSERLPEERGFYLTTTKDKAVYCDHWNGDNFDRTEMVIAWMPLPEPYKGGGR